MRKLVRKSIVILMLLWFPLSAGLALSATDSMRMNDTCHGMNAMDDSHNAGAHHDRKEKSRPCRTCQACQMACYGYAILPSFVTPRKAESAAVAMHQSSYVSITPTQIYRPPYVLV